MAHHKRRRSRRVVRCTLCTPHRWLGNARERFGKQPRRSTSRRPERADLATRVVVIETTEFSSE